MCGFAGWFDTSPDAGPPPSSQRRRAALDELRPRGPDGEGEWLAPDGRAGLLHRRLAIVDREGGAQPMAGPRDGQFLAWNGELFEASARRASLTREGHVFRTRSDTEVLARLLAGARRVPGARPAYQEALAGEPGQWAIAWIDTERGELLLARDPAGEKPLFVTSSAGRTWFASTLDALRALGSISSELDPEALSVYLSWGFVPAPRTIFAGVAKLRAGSMHVVSRGAPPPEWCEPGCASPPPGTAIPGPAARGSLDEALTRAARRRLEHSDEPVGVFLSSGLDSLAVAAVLRDAPGLRTFTIRAADPRYDESQDAARVAHSLGIPHAIIDPPRSTPDGWRDVLLRHGEPFGSTSALAVDAVARAASEHVRVVLTGDGGDEALGGYPRHVLLQRLARLPSLPAWAAPRACSRSRPPTATRRCTRCSATGGSHSRRATAARLPGASSARCGARAPPVTWMRCCAWTARSSCRTRTA